MNTTYLLTASAPQHISLKIEQLRSELFEKTGSVSALAFEAVIPLVFLDNPVPKTLFTNISLQGISFTTTQFLKQNNAYYLGIFPHPLFQTIQLLTQTYETSSLFDPVSGFFLATREPSVTISSVTSFLENHQNPEFPQWKNLTLRLLSLEYTDRVQWWNAINWFAVWESKLKTE